MGYLRDPKRGFRGSSKLRFDFRTRCFFHDLVRGFRYDGQHNHGRNYRSWRRAPQRKFNRGGYFPVVYFDANRRFDSDVFSRSE
jgi:hypothetical protein